MIYCMEKIYLKLTKAEMHRADSGRGLNMEGLAVLSKESRTVLLPHGVLSTEKAELKRWVLSQLRYLRGLPLILDYSFSNDIWPRAFSLNPMTDPFFFFISLVCLSVWYLHVCIQVHSSICGCMTNQRRHLLPSFITTLFLYMSVSPACATSVQSPRMSEEGVELIFWN